MLVRTEIPDIVSRKELDAARLQFGLFDPNEKWEEFEKFEGLKQELGSVGCATHRDGDLNLPSLGSKLDQQISKGRQLRER